MPGARMGRGGARFNLSISIDIWHSCLYMAFGELLVRRNFTLFRTDLYIIYFTKHRNFLFSLVSKDLNLKSWG